MRLDAEFAARRAKVATLTKYRAEDDPDLLAARTAMAESILVRDIRRALEKVAPINDELRTMVAELVEQAR